MGEAKRRREFREEWVNRHGRGSREGGRFRRKFGVGWTAVVSQALMAAPGIAELELAERSEKALKAYEMGHLVYEGVFHLPGVHELRELRGTEGENVIPWEQRVSDQIEARRTGRG